MKTRWILTAIGAAALGAALGVALLARRAEDPHLDVQFGPPTSAFPGATECAACHADTVEEWRSSAHAFAGDNPLIHAPICGRCHAPIGVMSDPEFMYKYAEEPPPDVLPAAASEGVTCVVCHAPIEVPPEQVLNFEPEWPNWRTTDLALRVLRFDRALGPFGSGDAEDEPPVQQGYHRSEASDGITRAEFCRPCHDLTVDKGPLEGQLQRPQPIVHLDTTYAEWEASDYPAQGETCQSCHMPRREDLAPAAKAPPGQSFEQPLPLRARTDHSFPGVHTAYWKDGPEVELQRERVATFVEGIATIDLGLPSTVRAGESFEIVATVSNVGVGHDLPSGYAFWRGLWLEVIVEDADGRTLFRSGVLDDDAWLPDEYNPRVRQDPSLYDPYLWNLRARLIRSPEEAASWIQADRTMSVPPQAVPRNRNGTPILGAAEFEVGPIVERVLDDSDIERSGSGPVTEVFTLRYGDAVIRNGIPAGESRQARYPVSTEGAASGPLRVSARLLMRPLARSMTSQQEELADAPPLEPVYEIEGALGTVVVGPR